MVIDITSHILVPKHLKVSDSEKEALLNKFNINSKELPKIMKDDPALAKLNVKPGDIIKIERPSKTAGTAVYYRVVIDG